MEATSSLDDGGSKADEEYERLLEDKREYQELMKKQKKRVLSSTKAFNLTNLEYIENTKIAVHPPEFFSFIKYRRNSRRKLIISNKDLFIIHG